MKWALTLAIAFNAAAGPVVDQEALGRSFGGWKADSGKAADYEVSGSRYRTYRPEVSPTPNGGIFVSVRLDHRRGWMASPDTASLEMTINPDGSLESAQSSLGFQGRRITSDVIRSSGEAGKSIAGPGIDHAVKISTDLVADLTSKLLREKIVEPGRVTFPAAIRHNFNLVFAAIRIEQPGESDPLPAGDPPQCTPQPGPANPSDKAKPPEANPPLEIKPFGK
jgi:hypothetical protein